MRRSGLTGAAGSGNFGDHLTQQVSQDGSYGDGGCRLFAVAGRDKAHLAHDGWVRQGRATMPRPRSAVKA